MKLYWLIVKTLLTIMALLLIPGWGILALTGYWRKWEPLQRWFLAANLGVAFWPVLYYSARTLSPDIRLGFNKLLFLMILFAMIIVWRLHKGWKEHFKLGKWGWLTLVVLSLTLLTRLYVAYQYPFLAGDDGLHHVLITEMTSTQGVLPFTLEPFGTTSLDHYHLGFYGMTAPLKLLAGIRSDQAVLWMSQFLSGICGVGVFLVLDKKASRPAAIIGMLTAGLLSPYPSWFTNWSRFTQLASQTILLPSALVFWEAISNTTEKGRFLKRVYRTPVIEAVLLISAVCLTHFRVAGFLLPLLLIIGVYELLIHPKQKETRLTTLTQIILVGLLVFIMIMPALLPGLRAYLDARLPDATTESSGRKLEDAAYYSEGDGDTMRVFRETGWLVVVMGLGILLALLRSKTRLLGIFSLIWVAFLVLFANAYRLNIYVLAFTNVTAIVLACYLPLSIVAGLLIESLASFIPVKANAKVENLVMVLTIAVAVGFVPVRIRDFEPHRAFMSPEDQEAMEWVQIHIPEEAIIGVNLNFVNPTMPYGTDAGYWLPYYANRKTTTLTLISGLDEKDQDFLTKAYLSRGIYEDPVNLQELCNHGITHLYSGVKQPLGSADFADNIAATPGENLIYNQNGVEIYQTCGK